MSRARRAKRTRKASRARRVRKGQISFEISTYVDQALKDLKAAGRKVVVLGTVKKGKVQIASQSFDDLSRMLPRSNFGFIALNAPFKTRAVTSAL
jgi:hypothetical protein